MENFYGKKESEIGILFGIFFVGSLSSIVLWVITGKLIGKKLCYIIAMILYIFSFGLAVLCRWPDKVLYFLGFLGGIATSGIYMMPLALAPDIIEWGQLTTDDRREGAYMGIWTLALKTGMGISVLSVTLLLSLIGYHHVPGKPISASTLNGLRLIFILLPTIVLILAAIIFSSFPISKEKHEEILVELEKRRAQGEGVIM